MLLLVNELKLNLKDIIFKFTRHKENEKIINEL